MDILDRLRSAAPAVFTPLPVDVAYLYGSHAGGRPRPDSDIDVGVLLHPGADADGRESRCADVLAAATGPGGIEVTVLDGAPLRFLGRVLRQRLVLFSRDEPRRVAYESLTTRMADDVEIWAGELDRDLLDAIARGER